MSETTKPNALKDLIRPELERLLGRDSSLKPLLAFHDAEVYPQSTCVPGSTGAHHAWPGGYQDHVLQCLQLVESLHASLDLWGVSLLDAVILLSDAVIVLYLHDVPKVLRDAHPTRAQRFEQDPAGYLEPYGVKLNSLQLNALKYVHGEGADYEKGRRVMCPLAALCHVADCLSARVFHAHRSLNLPKPVLGGQAHRLPAPEDREAVREALERHSRNPGPLTYLPGAASPFYFKNAGDARPLLVSPAGGLVGSISGIGTVVTAIPLVPPVQSSTVPPVAPSTVPPVAPSTVPAVPPPAASMAVRRAAVVCAGADLAREILTLADRADGRKVDTTHLRAMMNYFEEQLQAASPGVVFPGGGGQ